MAKDVSHPHGGDVCNIGEIGGKDEAGGLCVTQIFSCK